jgi:ribosome-associated translation inhibitor RaiA
MFLEVKGLGVEVTDRLADFCRERLMEPLTRVYDRDGARLEIELSDDNGPKGGLDKRCRITFEMPHTKSITVSENSADIYQAVDLAAHRFVRVVKRYKGWKLNPPRFPRKYYVAKVATGANRPDASPEDVTVEEDSLAVVEERENQELRDRGPAPGQT